MEARLLMIGDIVSVAPSGMAIRVAAVHKKKVAYHATTNKLEWVRESRLRPIPLTDDIMRKNAVCGLEYTKTPSGYRVVVQGVLSTWNALIVYVDNLQHAYRMNGIEREVEL